MKNKIFKKDHLYHVFNKSIAGYNIFSQEKNIQRFLSLLVYHNTTEPKQSFSRFCQNNGTTFYYSKKNMLLPSEFSGIKILAYCVMPDHYHLVCKILKPDFFSKYISDVENSYTRYFNIKYHRKGPLWQSRMKAKIIFSDFLFSHVVRYVHLNPTTKSLVQKPEQWKFSSYSEYITNPTLLKSTPEFVTSSTQSFKDFTENQIEYQRTLRRIKKLKID